MAASPQSSRTELRATDEGQSPGTRLPSAGPSISCRRCRRAPELLSALRLMRIPCGVLRRRAAKPAPNDWPPSKARTSLLELCGDAALVDLLTIRQLRRVRQLRAGNTRAELSVDEVEVVSNGRVLDKFEELEVELKDGDEAPLAALADLLAHSDDLMTMSRSKLE